MNDIYQASSTNPIATRIYEAKSYPSQRKLAVIGTVLASGPVFGLLLTVVAMSKAFSRLATSDGTADPSVLAGDISLALLATLYGGVIGIIGVVLVSIALFKNCNRERWFYIANIISGFVWCLTLLPVGVYLLIIFFRRIDDFPPKRRS